jgi:hypothetical protein
VSGVKERKQGKKIMNDLRKNWIIANFIGFTIGGVLHPIIAHGLTGGHEFWLTLPQFVIHTFGFLALSLSIAAAQRLVLKPFVRLGFGSVLLKAALVTCGLWVGYYTGGIPVDIILGFAVLGVVSGLEMRGKIHRWKQWMWASAAGYAAASLILIAILAPNAEWFFATFGRGLLGDLSLWIAISAIGGAAAGLLTAPVLAKSSQPASETAAKAELPDAFERSL